MTLRTCVGSLALAILGTFVAVGCSSNDEGQGAPSDAGADVKTARDTAPPPTGDDDANAPTCKPDDESGFAPTWRAPNPKSSACTSQQVSDFHKCFDDSSSPLCAQFQTNPTDATKACMTCMLSQDTATTLGPLIVHKTTYQLNTPGCLALAMNDPQGKGCAGSFQATLDCGGDACNSNCPVTAGDNASLTALNNCETEAFNGTCSKYYNEANSCLAAAADAGGDVARCLGGSGFDAKFEPVISVFCVGPEADGGADASTDAGDAATDAADDATAVDAADDGG